jgi:enoyl-CoA hydratase/carnithine racemase
MDMSVVTREQVGAVAVLTLNRPDKLNAVNRDVLAMLRSHLDDIEGDVSAQVVVIRGEGRAFCAGADLAMVSDLVEDPVAFADFMDDWHLTYNRIATFSLPTIAAIHGVALAGGFELLQVCDLAIATQDARIGDQHANFGLFPGGGSTQRLPRLIGLRKATWMLLSGEWVDGQTAMEWGIVNEAVPSEQLMSRTMAMADLLGKRSPLGSAAIKRAMSIGEGRNVADALILDRSIALEHMSSRDAQIGLEAFASRSEPKFARTRPSEK